MGTKCFLSILVCLMMASCASAPAPRIIQDTWAVDRPADEVWRAALETLAEMNIDVIEPTDKESGMIRTAMANIPKSQADGCDCGKLAFTQFKQGHRVKVTVFIKPGTETQTEMKIVANFEVLFEDSMDAATKSRFERAVQGDTVYSRPCVSTGKFELDFYSQVAAKLK